MAGDYVPSKDPDDIEPYHVVWCSEDGTNANTAADTGELKGATISTSNWTIDGATEDSENTNAITIDGVSYDANTVATVWVSGGTAGNDATAENVITTSDSRTLTRTIIIPIREH